MIRTALPLLYKNCMFCTNNPSPLFPPRKGINVFCFKDLSSLYDLILKTELSTDSAPLSYKEDLLAEINLMKKIGSHPNIVSMSGACTLSEPIALVMEYVPYGNLQNFLK